MLHLLPYQILTFYGSFVKHDKFGLQSNASIRGDIHTHVVAFGVKLALRCRWGFNLLTLSLWYIDSYQFSIGSPESK